MLVKRCAFRSPARSGFNSIWGALGLILASWALLVPICFVFFEFWARLRSKLRFEAICFDFGSILGGFWLDLGWIWGRFLEDSRDFC